MKIRGKKQKKSFFSSHFFKKKNKMSCPRLVAKCLKDWNISKGGSFVRERLARLKKEWPGPLSLTVVQQKALLFLHLKDVGRELDADTRLVYFKALVAPKLGGGHAQQQRLLGLVKWSEDRTRKCALAPSTLIHTMENKWHLCFNEHTFMRQAGSGFMVAPNLMVHYLVCRHNGGMLPGDGTSTCADLTKIWQRHVPPSDLWEYILHGTGGCPSTFLTKLCNDPQLPLYIVPYTTMSDAAIVDAMNAWGPALVSSLLVATDKYTSMVIVGYRSQPVQFLLQHSGSKEFLVCDSSFLVRHRAMLVWVTKAIPAPHIWLPDEGIRARFAQCAVGGTVTPGIPQRTRTT